MKEEKIEKIIEDLAVKLLTLPVEERSGASWEAWDMARRAEKGWWMLAGSPHYTARLEKFRKRLEKRK